MAKVVQSNADEGALDELADRLADEAKDPCTHAQRLLHESRKQGWLAALFDQWDTNDTGRVSAYELVVGLHVAGFRVREKEVSAAFAKITGTNVDKGLDLGQFIKVLDAIAPNDLLGLRKLVGGLVDKLEATKEQSQRLRRLPSSSSLTAAAGDRERAHTVDFLPKGVKQKLRRADSASFDPDAEHVLLTNLKRVFVDGLALYFTLVAVWILLASLLYTFINEWSFQRSVYVRSSALARDNPYRKRNETHEPLLARARRCAPPRTRVLVLDPIRTEHRLWVVVGVKVHRVGLVERLRRIAVCNRRAAVEAVPSERKRDARR